MARSSFRTIAVLTLLPVLGFAAFVAWRVLTAGVDPVVRTLPRASRTAAKQVVAALHGPPAPAAVATPKPAGSIVLIIDDLGFDGQPLERAMELDPNVNFAILPNGSRAADVAERLHQRGFEILVHLPMEPVGSASPGPNAILTSMSDEEIAASVRANLQAVPHARGVNNHMGSRATADRRVMASVLSTIPPEMYFVDSRTGSRSVAATLARHMKIRTAARDVFLDDVRTHAAIRQQVAALAAIARERGVAVGIGHPHQVTIDVLAEEIPRLRESGFRFLRASAVVD